MDLVRHLQCLGVDSPTGKAVWPPETLRVVLTNPTYTGQVYAGRYATRPAKRRRSPMHPIGKHAVSQCRTPAVDWRPVTQVPAIVSREDFDQVQQRLSQNRQFARRNNRVNQYLLRGLISCGHCQAACIGRGRCEDPRYHYYVCRNKSLARVSRPQQACPERMFPAAELDRLVWSDLCEVLQRPDLIAAALERAQGGGWLPQELQARRDTLMKAQSALRQQTERLDDAYLCPGHHSAG